MNRVTSQTEGPKTEVGRRKDEERRRKEVESRKSFFAVSCLCFHGRSYLIRLPKSLSYLENICVYLRSLDRANIYATTIIDDDEAKVADRG
jgi:hypothetical protein